ncbi:MAG: 5-dehydro-2-deoxygluconokinase [Eubacteriales bacterium]|nr:5-dehydro-2-deoxygluconokinase [Eubacteriales bacterium]
MKPVFTPERRPLDIIPVGRVAIDFNPTDYNRPLSESEHFNKYLGGSPANIAVGMARLGRKVGFLGKISDDSFGDFVEGFFRKEQIDVSHITRCTHGENLGLTFTEILSPEKSSILMYREGVADLMLHPDDVDEAYIASARSLLISGTALCASPTREAALKALCYARRNVVTVIFDADYRAYTWKNKDEISIYTSLVAERSDLILGSREEFDLMERLLGLDGSDGASAKHWLGKGAQIVVVKHGKQGSTAYTADGSYAIKPFPVAALKGFGGGDGYASAFLHGLMQGKPIIEALEMGSASAAMLIASHACSRDMPTEEALTAFIKEEKEKYGELVARA